MRFARRLKSLNVKLMLLLMPPLIGVALALSIGHGYLAYTLQKENIRIKQDQLAALLGDHVSGRSLSAGKQALQDVLQTAVLDPDVLRIDLFDARGAKITSASAAGEAKSTANSLEVVHPLQLPTGRNAGRNGDQPAFGSIVIQFDLSRTLQIAAAEVLRDIVSTGIIMLTATFGVWYLNRSLVTRPLRMLTASVADGEREDGAYRKVKWDSDDEVGVIIRTFNAAQERRKRESAALQHSRRMLADSEHRARAIAEAIPVPVVIEWLSDGASVYTNASARQALCGEAETLPPNLLRSLFVVARERERFFDSLNRGENVEGVEVLLNRPDGSRFWGALAARRIDLEGRRAVLCAIHDVSDHRQAKAALEAARAAADEANRAKDLFLANTGHEIRTPLNAILGLSRLALATDLTPEQWEHLNRIEMAATLLLGLIDDVLDFAKIGSQDMALAHQPFSLDDLISAVAAIHTSEAETKGLTFRVKQDGQIPPAVVGDSVRLGRILNNLMANAIKYTDTGGVTLEIRARKTAVPNHALIRFVVRDTGPGIDADKVATLFKPFVQGDSSMTRKHGGTGLGLAIVKDLVDRMDSRIEVDSTPGAGTAFSFDLMLEIASPMEADEKAVKRSIPSLSGKRILVVEDNDINQIVVQKILQRAGAAIEAASHGVAALAAMEYGGERFDAVLMDLQMPEMDGYQTTARLREGHSAEDLPIVALTANASAGERVKCLAAGMNEYLTKPVDPDVLVTTLARVIGDASYTPGESGTATAEAASAAPAPPTEPDGGPGDLPGLDVSDAMSRMGGDFDLYTELLRMFHGIYSDGLDAISAPLRKGDMEEARRAAHSLKGVAGNISATKLHRAAAKLEQTIKEGGTPTDIAEQFSSVEAELGPILETTARFS